MKRLTATVLLLLLVLCTVSTALAQTETDGFAPFLKQVNAERAVNMKQSPKAASYAKPYEDTITAEEAALLATQRRQADTISYEAAMADVDLYFRLLKTSYGPYFYFGGDEKFDEAKVQVEKAIQGKSSVRVKDLKAALIKALSFINDGHFSIGSTRPSAFKRHTYYYCDVYLQKDEQGVYQLINEEKWYCTGQTNADIRIEPTLKKDGEIVYSPLLLCAKKPGSSDYLQLTNEAGKEKNIKLRWKAAVNYKKDSHDEVDFEYSKKSDVPYVSVRAFPGARKTASQAKDLSAFVETGRSLKGQKLFIVDLRANSGGSDEYINGWLQNFAGRRATYPMAIISRGSRAIQALDSHHIREGWTIGEHPGSVIKNDSLILVLMDSDCGSSGESALNTLRCMDNVVVVGSQSGGWQLGGNGREYFLPHSGLIVCVPQALNLFYDGANVDGKGYAPDLWCDPSTSLDALLNMVERYGLNN